MKPPFPDQVLDRLNRTVSGRRQALLNRRPDPPKVTSLVEGVLTWEPPKELSNVTHFNVYAPDDTTLVARVPSPQAGLSGLSEAKAFVSAFNTESGLESARIGVSGTAESIVNTVNGVSGDVSILSAHASVLMTGAGMALTGGFVDVPGCTVTTIVDGTYDVTADVQFLSDGAVDGASRVQLVIGGVALTETLDCLFPAPYIVPGSKTWGGLAILAGVIVKLQAKKLAGAGASAIGTSTSMKLRSGFIAI